MGPHALAAFGGSAGVSPCETRSSNRPDRARRDRRSSVRPAADCNRSRAAWRRRRARCSRPTMRHARRVARRSSRHRARTSRPAHALLDRLAAAGAGGDLPIGMKAEQFAAAKHRLRLFGRARDEILHQHLVGERAVGAELPQRARSRSPSSRTNQMPRLAVPMEVLTTQESGSRRAIRLRISRFASPAAASPIHRATG